MKEDIVESVAQYIIGFQNNFGVITNKDEMVTLINDACRDWWRKQ